MKTLYFTVAACCALIRSAAAADVPTKAPPSPAPPVMLWTGCYGGANVGGVQANDNINWTPNLAGFPISGVDLSDFGSFLFHTQGFAGGGQVGCNYQNGPFAWGVEGDFGYTGINGTRSVDSLGVNAPSFSVTETLRSDFLTTIRGRIGLVSGPGGSWWFYGTGGGAVANVQFSDQACFALGEGGCNAASANQTRFGWTVGAGAEWAFAPRWSVKAEYLYVDLGTVTYTSTNSLAINPVATIVHSHALTENIERIGLNWHF
jgi:outer membrane immunogenic protein